MGRPERIVDEDVRVGGQGSRELRVVLLLLGVEAEVLEQQHLTVPQPLDGVLRTHPERVAGDRHVPVEEQGEALGDGSQAEPVLDLAVGPAEVAREDHPHPLGEERPDRRQCRPDALIVGHLAIGEGDIEVDPDEDALARSVDVPDGELVHGGEGLLRDEGALRRYLAYRASSRRFGGGDAVPRRGRAAWDALGAAVRRAPRWVAARRRSR